MLPCVVPFWRAKGVVFHLDEPTLKRAAAAPTNWYFSATRARERWSRGKWPCPDNIVPAPWAPSWSVAISGPLMDVALEA